MAIVKTFSDRNKEPTYEYGIAHPDDEDIKKVLKNVIPEIRKAGIKVYWVKRNGEVDVENP